MSTLHETQIELIDYLVESQFSFYTNDVRTVLQRHYLDCFVLKTIPARVVDELIEECFGDIVGQGGEGTQNVSDFAAEDRLEEFLSGDFYEPVTKAILAALACRDQLGELQLAEIKARYDEAQRTEKLRKRQRMLDAEVNAFFYRPEAEADFHYWSVVETLTIEEAVALSFGKDPRKVNSKSLAESRDNASPFAENFEDRLRQLERAFEAKTISPMALAPWFAKHSVDPDPRFAEWCKTVSERTLASKPSNETAKGPGIAIHRLLVGMAIKHYQFQPSYTPDDKSKVFQSIVNDLADVGLSIDVQTVRRHIVEANKQLLERDDFKKTFKKE